MEISLKISTNTACDRCAVISQVKDENIGCNTTYENIEDTIFADTIFGDSVVGNTIFGDTIFGDTIFRNTIFGETKFGDTIFGNIFGRP